MARKISYGGGKGNLGHRGNCEEDLLHPWSKRDWRNI